MSHYSDFGVSDAEFFGYTEETYNLLPKKFSPTLFDRFAMSVSEFEGFRSYPYTPAGEKKTGRTTVGYGHTFVYGDQDDKKYDFSSGLSKSDAIDLLHRDLIKCYHLVYDAIGDDLGDQISETDFYAFMDFVYNCGIGAFRRSSLLKKFKEGASIGDICKEFMRWNRSGNKVLPGLTNRCVWRCNVWLYGADAI